MKSNAQEPRTEQVHTYRSGSPIEFGEQVALTPDGLAIAVRVGFIGLAVGRALSAAQEVGQVVEVRHTPAVIEVPSIDPMMRIEK